MARDADFNNGKPLGVPALRSWDLNENSTRYDTILAAPSDDVLSLMWIIYSVVLFLFTIMMVIVFLAIVTNKKIRSNTFNLYLIFLMIPDIVFTGFCAINCTWLVIHGGYIYEWVCPFQSFYLIYGVAANAWLNGIIAYEVRRMLVICHSGGGQRYVAPTNKQVVRNSSIAYLWATFVALWGVVSLPWLPHESNAHHGITCTPLEYSKGSTIFFWTVFVPSLCLIPLLYAVGATTDVILRGLLPPSGRRRELAIYFFRIIFVFVIMWSPLLVVFFGAGGSVANPWVTWIGGLWSHMQGPVSTIMSCFKVDIRTAVLDFICCRTTESVPTSSMMQVGRRTNSSGWYSPSRDSARWLDSSLRVDSEDIESSSSDDKMKQQDKDQEDAEKNNFDSEVPKFVITAGGVSQKTADSSTDKNRDDLYL